MNMLNVIWQMIIFHSQNDLNTHGNVNYNSLIFEWQILVLLISEDLFLSANISADGYILVA